MSIRRFIRIFNFWKNGFLPLSSGNTGLVHFIRHQNYWAFFFTTTITGEVYLNIIEQFVALLEETDCYCWFQRDNARSCVARDTMAVLKSFFDDSLISSSLWPSRYPDLSSLDYFLWWYLKDQVYSPASTTLEDLKANIVRRIDRILFSMLQRASYQ